MTEQWKSIDSAPKDGTHILMWRNNVISEAWWRKDILDKYVWGGDGWSYPDWDMPTFWMPKPPAPVLDNRGEKGLGNP